VGLAVGVDYCLFYIRREREERARGADPQRALAVAAQTSGRSILVSGLTVIVAMAGMFVTGDVTFVSLATGTVLVVATAVAGSLTVLPALLATLGDRVDFGRIPGLYRRQGNGRIWGAVLDRVLRRPLVSTVLATVALGALAVPGSGTDDRGLRTRSAVAHGIAGTAGVITSAAVVMVAVFALFITMPIVSMKELGFGLATPSCSTRPWSAPCCCRR
jgi:uncharacterized membrane protein YdfJ with MMPL/SSD domain